MSKAAIFGGIGLAGIVAIKFLKKGAIIGGAAVVASTWSASDVQDYVNATKDSGYIGTEMGEGITVADVYAEDRSFVTHYSVTGEFVEEYNWFVAYTLSCDGEGNQAILENIESYKDVFIGENGELQTVVTKASDCQELM